MSSGEEGQRPGQARPIDAAGSDPGKESASGLTFFRQAGWMAMATAAGGVLMWLVHVPANARLTVSEYGVFLALLQVMNLLLIPALGLQTIVAQQTAAALTAEKRRQLAFSVRGLLGAVAVIWVGMVVLTGVFEQQLLGGLQVADPEALWITLGIALAMLAWPVMQGVLQGRQNFLWLGWLQVVNGAVRLTGIFGLVWWLGWQSAGAMTAALAGFSVTVCIAAWLSRDVWGGVGERVEWRGWLARVVPLTLGLGASQWMMAADQLLVQGTFHKDVTGLYGAAGTIGRALIFFTGAVFAVMFPKVVANRARGGRSNVLALALGATAVLGGAAALGCTWLPHLPLRLVYATRPEYWEMAPLVPWFAWCMLPLSLANVLIGNLLAQERFRAVPWLLLVAAGYAAALWGRREEFQAAEQMVAFGRVVRTLGVFSSLLLGVAAWFTWAGARDGRSR